ncbi:MAG: DUF192 domain-containing protein [Candidatus Pacebacteria bacterium]|nr:DUF192 domain-containing protein [Candidatus Paceibacterota bacterium]
MRSFFKRSQGFFTLVFIAIIVIFGIFYFKDGEKQKLVINNDIVLFVDVANTEAKRHQGLSFRESLAEDEGMLFIFDREGVYGFHMPDMNFPIDIFWIDNNKKIISIKQNALPEDYPEIYYPSEKAKYVLETTAGLSEERGIQIGDKVSW